jgi:hypothetical protein
MYGMLFVKYRAPAPENFLGLKFMIDLQIEKSRTSPLHLTELAVHFLILVTFFRPVVKKWACVSTS